MNNGNNGQWHVGRSGCTRIEITVMCRSCHARRIDHADRINSPDVNWSCQSDESDHVDKLNTCTENPGYPHYGHRTIKCNGREDNVWIVVTGGTMSQWQPDRQMYTYPSQFNVHTDSYLARWKVLLIYPAWCKLLPYLLFLRWWRKVRIRSFLNFLLYIDNRSLPLSNMIWSGFDYLLAFGMQRSHKNVLA